jgi:hypothetical protein
MNLKFISYLDVAPEVLKIVNNFGRNYCLYLQRIEAAAYTLQLSVTVEGFTRHNTVISYFGVFLSQNPLLNKILILWVIIQIWR